MRSPFRLKVAESSRAFAIFQQFVLDKWKTKTKSCVSTIGFGSGDRKQTLVPGVTFKFCPCESSNCRFSEPHSQKLQNVSPRAVLKERGVGNLLQYNEFPLETIFLHFFSPKHGLHRCTYCCGPAVWVGVQPFASVCQAEWHCWISVFRLEFACSPSLRFCLFSPAALSPLTVQKHERELNRELCVRCRCQWLVSSLGLQVVRSPSQ